MLLCHFHLKAFYVSISLIVGIIHYGAPYLAIIEFLDSHDVILVVVIDIIVGEVVFSVRQYDQNQVVLLKLAEQTTVAVVVYAVHVRVVPYVATAES